ITQREADTLQYGSGEMCSAVGQTQAEKRPPCGRTAMRRPLALEVRQKGDSISAARNARRFSGKLLTDVRIACQLTRELIAIPGERTARTQHNSHQVPEIGRYVAERVHAQFRIHSRVSH